MPDKVANLIAGGERLGKELKTDGTTIEPGVLIKLDTSGSTVSLANSTTVFGIAYGHRYGVYRPTTKVFADDEPLTVVWGEGEFLLSSDFFTGGSLPATGDNLFVQSTGLWGMQGATKVGKCIGIRTRTEFTGGTGANQNLAHVQFHIVP